MSYIGRGVDAISNVEKLDNITFNGGTTYALTKSSAAFTPVGANNILVSIDGVIQQGNFSVSTTNIVFDWSPTSSNTCNFILHYGTGVLNVPADGSVSAVKMAANSVDSDSYVDGSIDAVHLSANSVDSDAYVDGSIDAVHLSANSVDSDAYVDGSIDLAHMSSESVDEDNLHISNAGSNGQFLSKQSGNTGGLTWAAAGGDLSFGGDTFGADKTIGSNDTYALSFETDGNVAMKIDTAGLITQPLQCAFGVYKTANQTISNQTHTKITWSHEFYDVNADFDVASNSRFIAPVNGKYFFHAGLGWNADELATNTRSTWALRKNGTAVLEAFGSPTGTNDRFTSTHTAILNLSASDYIETWIHIDMGDSADSWHGNSGTYSYFYGHLMS